MNSPVVEEGEYGVGGLSARERLDCRRARFGTVIDGVLGEPGGLLAGGVRGRSWSPSSFSSRVFVLTRAAGGAVGRMPYFSGAVVYRVGRLQDSNSASSKGVTARIENPRIFLAGRFQQKSTMVHTKTKTRKPRTEARMI